MPAWLRRRASAIPTTRRRRSNRAGYREIGTGQAAAQGSRRALDRQIRQGQTPRGWFNAASRSSNPAIWLSEPCLALGKSAAMLFGASTPVQRSRKRTFRFRNTPVHITYHPGFVLRLRSAVGDLRILSVKPDAASPRPIASGRYPEYRRLRWAVKSRASRGDLKGSPE